MSNTTTVSVSPLSGTVIPAGIVGHTVTQIAEWLGIDIHAANGVLSMALNCGAAKHLGRHHIPGKVGRPAEVYSISLEGLLTYLSNRGTLGTTEVTTHIPAVKPPTQERKPRQRRDTVEVPVTSLTLAGEQRPDTDDGLDFSDVGDTAPQGINNPVSSASPSADTIAALADIALFG